VSGLKGEKLIKESKPTQKLKHANSIPFNFELYHFKVGGFFETQ